MKKSADLNDKFTSCLQSQGPTFVNNAEKEENQVNFSNTAWNKSNQHLLTQHHLVPTTLSVLVQKVFDYESSIKFAVKIPVVLTAVTDVLKSIHYICTHYNVIKSKFVRADLSYLPHSFFLIQYLFLTFSFYLHFLTEICIKIS